MAISQVYLGRAKYNFDIDGGAIGAITPANNFKLPVNAMNDHGVFPGKI